VTLDVQSHGGGGLAGAMVELGDGRRFVADAAGRVTVPVEEPLVAQVIAPGHLGEPVVLAPTDVIAPVAVALWPDDGETVILHAAGDVMFGRRFEAPERGQPLVPREDAAEGARRVVAAVAPLVAAADLTTVNLETVLTDRPDADAYQGKRFVLRSRPETTAALADLGVDVVNLANNHQRDFLEPGIADTLAALAAAGLARTGASVTDDGAADEPLVVTVRGQRIGFLAWTTIDGDDVNASYPDDAEAEPLDLAAEDAWLYRAQAWGASGPGYDIPMAERRPGSAWHTFAAVEPGLDPSACSTVWDSLAGTYPGLQDWVARRGHGGAASFAPERARAKIAALRPRVDVLVVQLHAGFQYQDAPSQAARTAATLAIDAGADLVVGHHPHVLQGLEWYRGKLIAWSLGNLVFDQDLGATFASAVLRTVWRRGTLVEARLLPVEIVDYQPAPVVGDAARRTLASMWAKSVAHATATVDESGAVRAMRTARAPHSAAPRLHLDRHSAVVENGAPPRRAHTVTLEPGAILALPEAVLVEPWVQTSDPSPGAWLGRELLGWGHFDDRLADGQASGGAHWLLDSAWEAVVPDPDGRSGQVLELVRRPTSVGTVQARPVARVPVPPHRRFDGDARAPVPADAAPSYSVALRVRQRGPGRVDVRVQRYHVDDVDEEPQVTTLDTIDLAVEVPDDDRWHEQWIDLPWPTAEDGTLAPNMAELALRLAPAGADTRVLFDDVRLIEWRAAAREPGEPAEAADYRYVRRGSEAPGPLTLVLWPMD
jgi:poly-gamma-glutamate capsule biosynthesis protein CapA/YwtB (metallophosphatase superfamily)